MAIIVVDPGAPIVTNDVEASWASIRTIINTQTQSTLRRDALNGFQLPRLLAEQLGTNRGRDYTFTNTPVVVDHEFTSTASADIRANWQNVLTLDGTPGTAGYEHGACSGIICASVFMGDTTFSEESAGLMAVTVEINGGLANKIHAGDWRYSMLENLSLVDSDFDLHGSGEVDTSMHLWTVYTGAAGATLTRVKLWVACTDAAKPWTMDNASLSLYLFNRVP